MEGKIFYYDNIELGGNVIGVCYNISFYIPCSVYLFAELIIACYQVRVCSGCTPGPGQCDQWGQSSVHWGQYGVGQQHHRAHVKSLLRPSLP